MNVLMDTDHILVYTYTFEEDGTYVIIDPSLKDRPDIVRRMLTQAYAIQNRPRTDGIDIAENLEYDDNVPEDAYLLILTPCERFLWQGALQFTDIPKMDLDLKDRRLRLVANGPHSRLARAKQAFMQTIEEAETDSESPTIFGKLSVLAQQQSLFPAVTREMRKISRSTVRFAEAVIHSMHNVRQALHSVPNSQELQELWFAFAADQGQSAQRHMDQQAYKKFSALLTRLAISWLNFITDDCDPGDRRTFRWAVQVLEFTTHRTRRGNVVHLNDTDFALLRQKVASCMTLLIHHFDILGARSKIEAKKEQERAEEMQRQRFERALPQSEAVDYEAWVGEIESSWTAYYADHSSPLEYSLRAYREKLAPQLAEIQAQREAFEVEHHMVGRVLDGEKPEDRSLQFLASSASNVQIRWQQGRFIGSGAFGQVYVAVNLDTGGLMAAKEIRFQDTSNLTHLNAVRDELSVMQMLHHPNIVEFYGIEVHRDKVFIFEEYCQGGTIGSILASGSIEDEVAQLYTLQILEGLHYLHSQGIVHRDIKPDSTYLVSLYRSQQGVDGFHRHHVGRGRLHQARRLRCGQNSCTEQSQDTRPHEGTNRGCSRTDESHGHPDVHVARDHQEREARKAWRNGHLVPRLCRLGVRNWQEAVEQSRQRVVSSSADLCSAAEDLAGRSCSTSVLQPNIHHYRSRERSATRASASLRAVSRSTR